MSSGADIIKPTGTLFTGAPVFTASPRPYHLALDWTVPASVPDTLGGGFITGFNIYRCGPGSGDCTPSSLIATVPANQYSYADTSVQPGQTYCYAVTYLYDDCQGGLTESPLSNIACGQICTNGCPQPEILITGNNAVGTSGVAPIQTYDFTGGALVNWFVPAGFNYSNQGRELAIYNGNIYYTEVPTDGIHICADGTEGSGSTTDMGNLLPNPDSRTNAGIQDLAFHNGELYVMSGYNVIDNLAQPPEITGIDPNPNGTGTILTSSVVLTGRADDGGHASVGSDGFTVLPNGHFLVNEGDGSPVYDEYNASGVLIPKSSGGMQIKLQSYDPSFINARGVTTDGRYLYFIVLANDSSSSETLVQISLTNLTQFSSQPVINPNPGQNNIEDIDVMILSMTKNREERKRTL